METKKLTAKDLMIGDWVYRPDCYDKVVEVRKDTILGSDPLRGLIPITELQPIPLTAKILRENFEQDEYNGYSYYEINDEFCIRNAYDRIFLAQWIDSENTMLQYPNFIIDLESVDQLQHALRLCGIDKEITL